MRWIVLSLWLVIALSIFEVTASQVGLITLGERVAGAAPSLLLMFVVPVMLIVVIWLTWRHRGRMVPRLLWLVPVIGVVAALTPLLFATETQSRESARILNAIAVAASGKEPITESGYRVVGTLPECIGAAGRLSLNHYVPMYREYALWLECQDSTIREIRLVRRGESLIILTVFSPTADHIQAFSDRKKNAVPVLPRS